MKYKGFEGSELQTIKYYGKIQHINDVVTYEVETLDDLEMEFTKAVDDYIETCVQVGKEPQLWKFEY